MVTEATGIDELAHGGCNEKKTGSGAHLQGSGKTLLEGKKQPPID